MRSEQTVAWDAADRKQSRSSCAFTVRLRKPHSNGSQEVEELDQRHCARNDHMAPSSAVRKPAFTAIGEPLAASDALPFWRLLQDAALNFPDRTALIFNDESL